MDYGSEHHPESQILLLKNGDILLYATAWTDTTYYPYDVGKLCIIRTDACGNIKWTNGESYAGKSGELLQSLEMDNGNILIANETNAGLAEVINCIRVGK